MFVQWVTEWGKTLGKVGFLPLEQHMCLWRLPRLPGASQQELPTLQRHAHQVEWELQMAHRPECRCGWWLTSWSLYVTLWWTDNWSTKVGEAAAAGWFGLCRSTSSRGTGHSDGRSSEQGSIITTMTGNIVEFDLALHEMLRYNRWNINREMVED